MGVTGRAVIEYFNRSGRVVFQMYLPDRDRVYQYLRKAAEKGRPVDLEIEKVFPKRNLDQNSLLWALCEILSFELYDDLDHKSVVYYELCQIYGPKVVGKIGGNQVLIPGSEMNTVQFAAVISGAFLELAGMDVSMDTTNQIASYWKGFVKWRYQGDKDPLEAKNLEDYRERVCACESCSKPLLNGTDLYRGHMAHIHSRGASGPDEPWNLLHLCWECHLRLQHVKGFSVLMDYAPHLTKKILAALKKEIPEE